MLNLLPEDSKSLVKKYLTSKIVKLLEHKQTKSGFTLDQAIRSGIVNADSHIGIYAGDADSYRTFSALFSPIIHDYHGVSKNVKQSASLQGVDLSDPDPENKYILSSRVRVARNLTGFPFTCHLDLTQRRVVEQKSIVALLKMKGDLIGKYFSREQLPDEVDFFFRKGDRFQEAAGINRDFPKARGVFCADDKRFRVWINEEDHLRLICQESSSDLGGVYNHLCKAHAALEKNLEFEKHFSYGYLSSCPTNLGTAMRAGVHICLPKLNQKRDLLTTLTEKYNLQIRGTQGEKTKVEDAVFDISNRQRLGIFARDIVTGLHQGLLMLIKAEQQL